ncbi:hypothetical protein LCGC14_2684980, partial [marine sediment metagenome]
MTEPLTKTREKHLRHGNIYWKEGDAEDVARCLATIDALRDELKAARACDSDALMTAERDAAVSKLLDVQQDCIDARKHWRACEDGWNGAIKQAEDFQVERDIAISEATNWADVAQTAQAEVTRLSNYETSYNNLRLIVNDQYNEIGTLEHERNEARQERDEAKQGAAELYSQVARLADERNEARTERDYARVEQGQEHERFQELLEEYTARMVEVRQERSDLLVSRQDVQDELSRAKAANARLQDGYDGLKCQYDEEHDELSRVKVDLMD